MPLPNVALASMEAATPHRLFPGRVSPAFGHGVQEWMGRAGARVASPLTLLREHLDAARALLRGERVTTSGRYVRLDDVALERPPSAAPPLLTGGRGPGTLRLAGEAADGTVLTSGNGPDAVRRAGTLIEEGLRAAWRTDPHLVIATGPAAAGRPAAERAGAGESAEPGAFAAGDARTVAAAIREPAAAGADSVTLEPTPDEPDIEGFVRFVATEVRPLVP